MARCPKCDGNWFWDWEQDIYRYLDGSPVEILNFVNTKSGGPKIEIYVFKCKCGAINSVMFADPNTGMFVRCIDAWSNIDWESKANNWGNKCLNCKDQICLNKGGN